MSRILVVDDEPQLARAVSRILSSAPHDVTVVLDGRSALDVAAASHPDLLVVDLNLPDIPGIRVIRTVREWFAGPILVLSGITDEWQKVAALEAGADDYLIKPFGVDELRARVNALMRRPGGEAPAALRRFGNVSVDPERRWVSVGGVEKRLTPIEWRLLDAFTRRPGKLLTHQWLLRHAWEDGRGDESKEALRVHIRSLRHKLEDSAIEPHYLRTESGMGYRWISQQPDGSSQRPATDTSTVAHDTGSGLTSEAAHSFHNALGALQLSAHELADLLNSVSSDVVAEGRRILDRIDALTAEAVDLLTDHTAHDQ